MTTSMRCAGLRRWRMRAAKTIFVAAVSLTLFGAGGSVRADNGLEPIGGPGGGGFEARCRSGEWMIGVALRRGDDIDAIRPLCAQPGGPREPNAALRGDWHGGGGGSPTNIVCARNDPFVNGMLVTLEGTDRNIVNDIGVSCGPGTGRQPMPGSVAMSDSEERTHGLQHCPSGQIAVGMHGRSGLMLDAVGLICDAASTAVKSLGRVKTSGPSGPPMSLCERAADARRRNSPAAPNLEAQCQASKTPVKSLGRVPSSSPSGTPMSLCERAADARKRNSPAAPNLEAQCRAASSGPISTPNSDPTQPADSSGANTASPMSKDEQRDALFHSIAESIVSLKDRAHDRDASPANADGTIPGEQVTGNRQTRYPTAAQGRHLSQAQYHNSEPGMLQPEHSIHVIVQYPVAYGYTEASDADHAPNSCGAFYVLIMPVGNVRPNGPPRIDTMPRMRSSSGTYACDYLIRDVPFDRDQLVRVAMSDQRAAGSAIWLGGTQPQPPPGQRRSIADEIRKVQLTTDVPRATLRFAMNYGDAP